MSAASAASLALVLAALAGPARAAAFDVVKYEVIVAPDLEARAMSGATRMRLVSLTDGLDRIEVTANALTIDSATLDGTPAASEVAGARRIFRLPRPLHRGEAAVLEVRHHGSPAKGLNFAEGAVWTSWGACDWMICDIEAPGDKAALDLELVLPRGMQAFASGRLVSRQALPDGREAQRWREGRPYSSYLFGFVAGKFQRVDVKRPGADLVLLGQSAPPERLKALFGETGKMVDFFEAKAGVKLPHDYAQLLIDGSEAQEASTFSVIGTEELEPVLADPHEDWAVAHELSHQWWGNLITGDSWANLWLGEGMTVFMTAAWKEHRWGRADYDREMRIAQRRWDAVKAEGFDVPLAWPGTYPSLRHRRAIEYSKGALFMDLLRRQLGEKAFWRGIRRYSRANAGGVVTGHDLEAALETESRQDLSALFETWVYGPAKARASGS